MRIPNDADNATAGDATALEMEGLAGLEPIGQAALLPPRESLLVRLGGLLGRHHSILLALCVLLTWAITSMPLLWQPESFQVGQIVAQDILAPATIFLPDPTETATRRREAAALVLPDYKSDPAVQAKALAQLHAIVTAARRTISRTLATAPMAAAPRNTQQLKQAAAARLRHFNAQLNPPLARQLAVEAIALPLHRWGVVERAAAGAVRAVYGGGPIRSDIEGDLARARTRIAGAVRQDHNNLKSRETALAAELALVVAREPNLIVNARATQLARRKAQNEVREVFQQIERDTPVIKAGEKITEENFTLLQKADLATPRLSLPAILARLAICILLVALAAGYVHGFHRSLVSQPGKLWLIALVPILFLAIFRLLLQVPHADLTMVPLAATAAMLLTILIDPRIGLLTGFLVAAWCALIAGADAVMFLAATVSAWVGVLTVSNIASRGQLVRAAFLLAMTNVALALAGGVLRETSPASRGELLIMALCGLAAGLFSTVVTAGLAMLLERPFGITTHLRLLELLSPDELVMRRMQSEAPGTYTHSLMVAMLGEAAAKAVGADPLLCRVGGLYHDIGKLRRPHCFVENQSGDNIHDRLRPELSALLILAHVKDGLELGRALRLPQPILDIIAQHHGTTLISYFYRRALNGTDMAGVKTQDGETEEQSAPAKGQAITDESKFRYAGPRPQSKEAAIVMLADGIEASARALTNFTVERLQQHIKLMIDLRLQEGELSDCELTLRDLCTVETSFTHVLRGVLHHRIEYPDTERESTAALESSGGWVRETLSEKGSDAAGERRSTHGDRRRSEAHDETTEKRFGERRNNGNAAPMQRKRGVAGQ